MYGIRSYAGTKEESFIFANSLIFHVVKDYGFWISSMIQHYLYQKVLLSVSAESYCKNVYYLLSP